MRRTVPPSAEIQASIDKLLGKGMVGELAGPEVTYASEKLGFALYKCAEGLALCGVELEEVVSEVHRGYRHGVWIRDGEQR